MKCTGRLKDISIDFFTRKTVLSLEVNEDVTGEYDKLKDKDKLAIEVKQWRRKRSLDANAYFHVLVSKIADELRKGPVQEHSHRPVWTAGTPRQRGGGCYQNECAT